MAGNRSVHFILHAAFIITSRVNRLELSWSPCLQYCLNSLLLFLALILIIRGAASPYVPLSGGQTYVWRGPPVPQPVPVSYTKESFTAPLPRNYALLVHRHLYWLILRPNVASLVNKKQTGKKTHCWAADLLYIIARIGALLLLLLFWWINIAIELDEVLQDTFSLKFSLGCGMSNSIIIEFFLPYQFNHNLQ